MNISLSINGVQRELQTDPDTMLLEALRGMGLMGAKRGCDTQNCGLCTVWVDGAPILSCSYPAAKAAGRNITTIEGVREDAARLGGFLADQGAEQCGYCSPGLIMTVLAMERELTNPSDEDIRTYLAGNLCRCSGYVSQLRGIRAYLEAKKA